VKGGQGGGARCKDCDGIKKQHAQAEKIMSQFSEGGRDVKRLQGNSKGEFKIFRY